MRRGNIFDVYLYVVGLALFAIGGKEGGIGTVEHVEETLVERQAGTQHGAHHDAVVVSRHFLDGKGCLNVFDRIVERATHLVGHGVGDAAQVAAEERAVGLRVHIAQLRHEAVNHGATCSQIYDFHDLSGKKRGWSQKLS